MDFGSILSTIFSGGITGVIGSIVSGISNYKLKKLEYEHEEKMAEIKTKLIEAQTKQTVTIAEETRKTMEEVLNGEVLKKSYETDRASYVNPEKLQGISGKIIQFLLGIVDFMRGLIRPGTTIAFEVYMFIVWFLLFNMVHGFKSIPEEKLSDLFYTVTLLLLYVASTCITWWFGSRQHDKWMDKIWKNK